MRFRIAAGCVGEERQTNSVFSDVLGKEALYSFAAQTSKLSELEEGSS